MESLEILTEPLVCVPVKVHFFDTDAGGFVHNTAYLRFIEIARAELLEKLGWSLKDSLQNECPVVIRSEIDYLKPARLGDQLDVHARLGHIEKVRFSFAFEIVRASDAAVISRASQTMVIVDPKTRHPKPLRDRLQQWESCAAPE